tara:strand:- start:400 stop:648 length:249 start_codon:yes stop_codon:yes gene_type:complete
MRIVRNTSLQGFYISFTTPEGNKDIFLAPKSSIETPDSWSSSIAENLVRRRMATIKHVEDKDSMGGKIAAMTPVPIKKKKAK